MIHEYTHFMRIRKVDTNLQMRIRRYIEYMHDESTSGFNKGKNLLNHLSSHLKNELLESIYMKSITSIPIFKNNFSERFLKRLSSIIEEKTYSPDDIIYEVLVLFLSKI